MKDVLISKMEEVIKRIDSVEWKLKECRDQNYEVYLKDEDNTSNNPGACSANLDFYSAFLCLSQAKEHIKLAIQGLKVKPWGVTQYTNT